jgi:hypothetical protein
MLWSNPMREERRVFFRRLGLGMVPLILAAGDLRGLKIQDSRPQPIPDAKPGPISDEDKIAPPAGSRKAALEENEKDIKKKVEKLFRLATELKDEVEKTDSVTTLSVAMLRKADEIERLAKDIKTRAKG